MHFIRSSPSILYDVDPWRRDFWNTTLKILYYSSKKTFSYFPLQFLTIGALFWLQALTWWQPERAAGSPSRTCYTATAFPGAYDGRGRWLFKWIGISHAYCSVETHTLHTYGNTEWAPFEASNVTKKEKLKISNKEKFLYLVWQEYVNWGL